MKKKLFSCYIRYLFTFLVSIVIIFSVGCTGGDKPVLETQRGSLSGVVLDNNSKAVRGAIVTSNRSLYKAETDEMGRFLFTSLDEGHHYLTVEREGYYLGSATIKLGYGQTLDGISIIVEGSEKMLNGSLAVKDKTQVVLDVLCYEPMSVFVSYRELSTHITNTAPTGEFSKQHRITLSNLFPGSKYQYTITGKTSDGRTFTTENAEFTTVHLEDIEGNPDSPINFTIVQGFKGPVLSWEYDGADPIQGFRIYRSENDSKPLLYRTEEDILSSQTKIEDDCVYAGRYYTYEVYAVDKEGNLSDLPAKRSFVPAGDIMEDIYWKKSWSPIDIEGDIRIPSRYSITIEPGTSVRFKGNSSRLAGINADVCEFIVEGCLIAKGTEAEPITFLSQSSIPQKNDWDGIRFMPTVIDEKPSILEHIIVSSADKGLAIYSPNIVLNNYVARYCNTGLSINACKNLIISDLTLEACELGLRIEATEDCAIDSVTTKECTTPSLLNRNTNLTLTKVDFPF